MYLFYLILNIDRTYWSFIHSVEQWTQLNTRFEERVNAVKGDLDQWPQNKYPTKPLVTCLQMFTMNDLFWHLRSIIWINPIFVSILSQLCLYIDLQLCLMLLSIAKWESNDLPFECLLYLTQSYISYISFVGLSSFPLISYVNDIEILLFWHFTIVCFS